MAKEASPAGSNQKTFWGTLPWILTGIIFAIIFLQMAGIINIQGILKPAPSDYFVGVWNTASPAAYYSKDIDGERYARVTANFHLIITREYKGYMGKGWLTEATQQSLSSVFMPPLVANPGGSGYGSPLAFDARGYLEPQPGISSLQLSNNTMIITTPLSGGSEKIVIRLSEDRQTMYASLSVIPTSSGSAMGEETDSDIVLLRVK